MKLPNVRLEVMQTIEKSMGDLLTQYLKPIETNWQPSDLLPDSRDPDFFEQVEEIQALSKEMSYDLLVTLIGDTITEEALPTYESWLMDVQGIDQHGQDGWSKWIRGWTAEENRHGDLLNKYLYLCGRVDMRQMEISTQHLINSGFDIQTGNDPYRNFIYTSFQELATNVSHRRVASQVKLTGNVKLAKICGLIAADEARHARAYMDFVDRIFAIDASEMMLAFEDMMRKKIVMPAQFVRESGEAVGTAFENFSNAAQRLGVYTTHDYIDILRKLNVYWEIDKLTDLTDTAKKARDYVMKLPDRMARIADRVAIPEDITRFKWVEANGML